MFLKNRILLFLITIICKVLLISACSNSEENTICNVENPLENLSFLKEAKDNIDRIDCGGKSSITQYTYNNNTVFEVIICDQITNGQTLIYNCSGDTICIFGGIAGVNTCPDFNNNKTNKKQLYGN